MKKIFLLFLSLIGFTVVINNKVNAMNQLDAPNIIQSVEYVDFCLGDGGTGDGGSGDPNSSENPQLITIKSLGITEINGYISSSCEQYYYYFIAPKSNTIRFTVSDFFIVCYKR